MIAERPGRRRQNQRRASLGRGVGGQLHPGAGEAPRPAVDPCGDLTRARLLEAKHRGRPERRGLGQRQDGRVDRRARGTDRVGPNLRGAASDRRHDDAGLPPGTKKATDHCEIKRILRMLIEGIKLAPETLSVEITYRLPEPVMKGSIAGPGFEPGTFGL